MPQQKFLLQLRFQNNFTDERLHQSNIQAFHVASLTLYQLLFLSQYASMGSMPIYLTRHTNTPNMRNLEICTMTITLIYAEKWCKNKNDIKPLLQHNGIPGFGKKKKKKRCTHTFQSPFSIFRPSLSHIYPLHQRRSFCHKPNLPCESSGLGCTVL